MVFHRRILPWFVVSVHYWERSSVGHKAETFVLYIFYDVENLFKIVSVAQLVSAVYLFPTILFSYEN
jgi:hypothetical protein